MNTHSDLISLSSIEERKNEERTNIKFQISLYTSLPTLVSVLNLRYVRDWSGFHRTIDCVFWTHSQSPCCLSPDILRIVLTPKVGAAWPSAVNTSKESIAVTTYLRSVVLVAIPRTPQSTVNRSRTVDFKYCCRDDFFSSNLPVTSTTIDTPISRPRSSYAPVLANVYDVRRSRRLTAVNPLFGSSVSHRIGSRGPSQVIPRLSRFRLLRISLPAHVASSFSFYFFFFLFLYFFVSLLIISFFKNTVLSTSPPLPFSQTRVPRDSSIDRVLLNFTDTRTGRDQAFPQVSRTSQPTLCSDVQVFFVRTHFFSSLHDTHILTAGSAAYVPWARDEYALQAGVLYCSDITGMASSSVSQEDFDNDFELTSRRSRIRTARARVGPARTGDVSSISFQSTCWWSRKCLRTCDLRFLLIYLFKFEQILNIYIMHDK